MMHLRQTPAPHRLHPLRVEELRQWHPARFRRRALCPLACRLDPLAIVRQQRGRVLLEAIGEKERYPARRQHLGHLVDHALRHGQRAVATASLTSPVFTALRRAKSSSSCTWVTRTSCSKYCEKAAACSATSTNQARTVLGSTSNTRATARMPQPSASVPTAHTSFSGATRLPCNGVPHVSRTYPSPWLQYSWRHRPPLG